MRGELFIGLTKLQFFGSLLVLFYIHELCCSPTSKDSHLSGGGREPLYPMTPIGVPQPFLPFLAPSPSISFPNSSVPKLSGSCPFNFSGAETIMSITSMDCFSLFAKYMANVVCCPQLQATLVILIGHSSKSTNLLALNETLSKQCLSDVEQVLVSQGANNELQQLCHVNQSNLTEGSCPVKDVGEFEKTVDTSKLLAACEKMNVVNECCMKTCQNAISVAAKQIAAKDNELMNVPQLSSTVEDCQNIVLRWLASKLEPSHAKEFLRGLSNCNINKDCPLTIPDTKPVVEQCGNVISNKTACCSALSHYMLHLQNQSFTTNLQAMNCAAALGRRLQRKNITSNIYKICHVSLKQFSLMAGIQESGCLLQSLPSDVILDKKSGMTFLCDLNDNIAAPWPSAFELPPSSCNKSVNIPALPAAASGEIGLYIKNIWYCLFIMLSAVLILS